MPTLLVIIALFGPSVDGGLRLGGGLLDEAAVLAFQPWLAFEGKRVRVAVGPPINVHLADGNIRERDWDEAADYGRIIHTIRWGDWLHGGVIANRSVGNGTLVRRYHNGIDRDHARLGLDLHLDTKTTSPYVPNHYELMLDQVLGAPVSAMSVGRRWQRGHVLLTYVADFAAPNDITSRLDDDGWLASDRVTRFAYGLSASWMPFSTGKEFRLRLLGDLNSVGSFNVGIHAGVDLNYEVRKRWRLNLRVMALRLSRGYTWSLFDTGYLIDRWRGIHDELSDSASVFGGQGHLEFVFADALFIGMEYADCEQASRTDVGAWVRVPIERITVGAFWKARRVDGIVDAFSDDKFMAAFSLRARLQESLFTELVLARDWFADSGAAGYLPSTSALLMLEANWGR